MVELLTVELGQEILFSVVFQMTTCAIGLCGRNIICAGVITNMGFDTAVNFFMAVKALQPSISQAEVMARCAVGCAFQIRMGSGKGARRDLSFRKPGREYGCPQPQRTYSEPLDQQRIDRRSAAFYAD